MVNESLSSASTLSRCQIKKYSTLESIGSFTHSLINILKRHGLKTEVLALFKHQFTKQPDFHSYNKPPNIFWDFFEKNTKTQNIAETEQFFYE